MKEKNNYARNRQTKTQQTSNELNTVVSRRNIQLTTIALSSTFVRKRISARPIMPGGMNVRVNTRDASGLPSNSARARSTSAADGRCSCSVSGTSKLPSGSK